MTNLNKNNTAYELNEEELFEVNGGNWLTDAWDATCDWCKEHKGAVIRGACIVGGIALTATGIGAGAGLGLIAVESIAGAAIVATGVGTIGGTVVGGIITQDMD